MGSSGAVEVPVPAAGRATVVERMPATLPLRCSIRAFCFCLTESMERTCSRAAGSSRWIERPMTTGEMGVELVWSEGGMRMSVLRLRGWGVPLIVTRRFFAGVGRRAEGGGACGESRGSTFIAFEGWSSIGKSCSSLIWMRRGERRLEGEERVRSEGDGGGDGSLCVREVVVACRGREVV